MKLGPVEFNAPTWDGKLVLAAIFILGYYALVLSLVFGTRDLSGTKADIVRDAMLTLGPPIGVIIGALFRTTAAEERREALRSTDFQAALTAPASGSADVADDVEKGARDGTRAGVRDAVSGSPASDVGLGSVSNTTDAPAPYVGPGAADLPPPDPTTPEAPRW